MARASARKRSSEARSLPICREMNFNTTRRFMVTCWARSTLPPLPSPSLRRSLYLPTKNTARPASSCAACQRVISPCRASALATAMGSPVSSAPAATRRASSNCRVSSSRLFSSTAKNSSAVVIAMPLGPSAPGLRLLIPQLSVAVSRKKSKPPPPRLSETSRLRRNRANGCQAGSYRGH